MELHPLYPDFLDNPADYAEARGHWRQLLTALAEEYGLSMADYFQTEPEEMDGNPIYSVYFPDLQRAVRIIQLQPDEYETPLAAWLDTIELDDDTTVDELVVDLILAAETLPVVEGWLHAWLVKRVTPEEMEEQLAGEDWGYE